jgi:hypothetical protein|tara:strand:+ start:336 stop:602 length:267 start_codon:yes stop_codon:yes gene_type:complete
MKPKEQQLATFFCRFIASQAGSHANYISEEQDTMDRICKDFGDHILKQDAYINRIIGQMQDICEKHDITFAIDGNRPSIDLEAYGYEE